MSKYLGESPQRVAANHHGAERVDLSPPLTRKGAVTRPHLFLRGLTAQHYHPAAKFVTGSFRIFPGRKGLGFANSFHSRRLREGSKREFVRSRFLMGSDSGRSGDQRPTRRVSDFAQSLVRVAEAVEPHADLVHQRQVQAAHLPVRLAEVVEHTTGLDLAAALAEQHHR